MDSGNIQYAEARDWQDIMKNRSRLKMHELIERLGLRAKWSSNKRGKTNFDSPLVKDLVNDMTNVVSTLPKETDELIAHLATPNSLKNEVDLILHKHGSAIWGRMGDREHLVSVGEPDVEPFYYPRDLYFENEEDRELIRMLLHWWIGLKACNVILARERLDRERRKKEERLRARDEHASPREPNPTVAIAPAVRPDFRVDQVVIKTERSALPFGQPPPQVQALRLDTSYSNPGSPMSGTPVHSNDSPIFPNHGHINGSANNHYMREANFNASRRPSALSQSISSHIALEVDPPRHTSTPPLPSLHQLSSELGNLVSNFLEDNNTAASRAHHTPSPVPPPIHEEAQRKPPTRRSLDTESLRAFRAYIYPGEGGPKWDEEILLRRLETAWRDDVRASQLQVRTSSDTAVFAARDRAFLTWIELRRHLADLEAADKRWRQEGDQACEIEARIAQHKTLMSASRDIVRNWEDIGQGFVPDGFTADDLLVQAFALLAGDSGTEDLLWASMGVEQTMQWLKGHLEQFQQDEAENEEDLLYVRL